jgi:hypothetical protein
MTSSSLFGVCSTTFGSWPLKTCSRSSQANDDDDDYYDDSRKKSSRWADKEHHHSSSSRGTYDYSNGGAKAARIIILF